MAQAGFWAVSSGKISFRRDGRWYSDDEPINNARIAKLFSRACSKIDDGRWQIAMADERAFVEIDDTPWVVTASSGDAATRLHDPPERRQRGAARRHRRAHRRRRPTCSTRA